MAMASTSIHSATMPLHSTSTNTSLVCNNSCAPPPLAKLHVGGAAGAAGGGGGKGGDFFLCNNLCGHMYGNCCALVIKPRKRNRTPAVAPLAAIATSADAPTTDSANLLQLKTELLVSCSAFSIFQISKKKKKKPLLFANCTAWIWAFDLYYLYLFLVVEVLLLCGLGTHFCALSWLLVLRVIEICELWLGEFWVQSWVLFVLFLFFGYYERVSGW